MSRTALRRRLPVLGAVAIGLASLWTGPVATAAPSRQLPPGTRFFVPAPNAGAVTQVKELTAAKEHRNAALIKRMINTPQAVWFTGGTPAEVKAKAKATVAAATRRHEVPVLVAYDIPFRDCAQYSSGGALSTADYLAWIDGFASGIGKAKAVVLLEPDGLGIIPFNTDINGNAEWCKPADTEGNPQPGASSTERYKALNGAVDRLGRQPNVSVYLDATHSGWLGVGDAADRLVKAGVQRAQGFFLNVSNYQTTERQQKYGTWISSCIAYANNPQDGGWRLGNYSWCGSQYYPASSGDFSTWGLTDQWYADNLGTAVPTTHFVVDTSRNGQGPNDMSAYAGAPYNQPADVVSRLASGNWCNPPGRGLGLRPTARTGVPLLDAYLWVKLPGESDGSCDSAAGARAWDFEVYNPWNVASADQSHFDPLWGMVDPAAGQWFAQQALELAQQADPPLISGPKPPLVPGPKPPLPPR
ncbi:MAG: glycoside hydrolase family 6 protein [Actinomycetales bacterium]|nr:glycoside hydrolase family 6 protein [Actinomycetales bacterium]